LKTRHSLDETRETQRILLEELAGMPLQSREIRKDKSACTMNYIIRYL